MGVHEWARQELAGCLVRGEGQGFEAVMCLRALLSVVVEQNNELRGAADLARELEFLADNLDSERDYAFMRP